MEEQGIKNWIPFKLDFRENSILCKWVYLADKQFIEPFFQDTVSICSVFEENKKVYKSVSTLEGLIALAETLPEVKPTAFVFHVSRCGSTLLSQLLALDSQNVVISEAPILDVVLRELRFSNENFTDGFLDEVLKAVVKFLGQKRTKIQNHFIVKLDSWHIFYVDILRKLYPDVPFVFSYRQPDEVINSHLKERGMHMVAGLIQPELFGFEFQTSVELSPVEFITKVLERYYDEIHAFLIKDCNYVLLDYGDGVWHNFEKMCGYLKLELSEEVKLKAQERLKYQSKRPSLTFDEDKVVGELDNSQQKVMGLFDRLNACK